MKTVVVCLLLIMALISPVMGQAEVSATPQPAQNFTGGTLTISFDEASVGDPCLRAMDSYAGIWSSMVFGEGVTLPQITAGQDVSHQCQFNPGNSVTLHLGRPANSFSLSYSGALNLQFLNASQPVGEAALNETIADGVQPTYQEDVFFDEVVITETSGTDEASLFALTLSFMLERSGDFLMSFDNVAAGTTCPDAFINSGLSVFYEASQEGVPLVADTSDAGRVVPECNLREGDRLIITLPRPAAYVEFAVSGSAIGLLSLDGQPVAPPHEDFGPFTWSATSISGFDTLTIIATELGARIDDIAFEFLRDGLPMDLWFNGQADATCAETLASYDGLVATGAAGENFPEPQLALNENGFSYCEFNPASSLTINLERRATVISLRMTGGAQIELRRDGELVREPQNFNSTAAYYMISDAAGIDQITLTESSGFSSFRLESIHLAIAPAGGGSAFVDFYEAEIGTVCTDLLAEQGIEAIAESTTDFEVPMIAATTPDTAFGFDVRCEFNPGNFMTFTFDNPVMIVNFQLVGGARVEAFRDGELVRSQDAQGLPGFYNEIFLGGIDVLTISEPSGFSSIGITGMQFIFADSAE